MFNIKNVIFGFMATVLVLLPIFFILDFAGQYMDSAVEEEDSGYETMVE